MTNEERERLQALLNNQAIMLEQGRQLVERALAWLAQVEQIRRLLLERLQEDAPSAPQADADDEGEDAEPEEEEP